MTGIVNIITSRLTNLDFTHPLALVDLLLAVGIVLAFMFYLKKFPVFRVLLGILFLLLCSIIFLLSGLVLTALVFGIASNLILISLPLIFAPEIRHYLEKLGRFSFIKVPKITKHQKNDEFIRNLVDSVFELAERKIGGTLVVQRRTGLGETVDSGVLVDAKFGSRLLQSIFFPKSPLHDGAVVIHSGKIVAAKCLLPISSDVRLDSPFGTRHKSALAITLDTDAVVIIISEQRGEVSLAENGKLQINLEREGLTSNLIKLLKN